jgi:predicted nucleic acid-binding protein
MKLLLDTTVLIDVLRNKKGRRQVLADLVRAGHTVSTSALNVAEVYAGMRASEEARTEASLEGLEEFNIGG